MIPTWLQHLVGPDLIFHLRLVKPPRSALLPLRGRSISEAQHESPAICHHGLQFLVRTVSSSSAVALLLVREQMLIARLAKEPMRLTQVRR